MLFQSPVLPEILQQGSTVNTGRPESQQHGHITATSSSYSQGPSVTVVGATPAELESLKELIRFDHIYHKTEPHPDNKPVCSKSNKMKAPVSILPKMSGITPPLYIINTPENSVDMEDVANDVDVIEIKDESAIDNFNDSEPILDIDVEDQLKNLQETLEQLLGMSELEQDNIFCATEVDPAITSETCSDATQDIHESSILPAVQPPQVIQNPRKRKSSIVPTSLVKKNLLADHLSIPENIIYPPSPISPGIPSPGVATLETVSFTVPPHASLSDSGYGSEVGEAPSPNSCPSLSDNDCDLTWEDTFTELFPTLM